MENPKLLKKKIIAVSKAGFCGAVFFGGSYLISFWSRGAFGVSYFLVMILSVLPERIRDLTGWNAAPVSDASAIVFELIVNAILGTFLFVVGSVFYQFTLKKKDDV